MKNKSEEIKQFVKDWMEGHESDTFVRNEHVACLYSSGHSTLNLEIFFEELLIDFAEAQQDGWISVKERYPKPNVKVLVCITYGGGSQEIQLSYTTKRDPEMFDHFLYNNITHWKPITPPEQ